MFEIIPTLCYPFTCTSKLSVSVCIQNFPEEIDYEIFSDGPHLASCFHNMMHINDIIFVLLSSRWSPLSNSNKSIKMKSGSPYPLKFTPRFNIMAQFNMDLSEAKCFTCWKCQTGERWDMMDNLGKPSGDLGIFIILYSEEGVLWSHDSLQTVVSLDGLDLAFPLKSKCF